MVTVSFLPVAIEFITGKYCPMTLISICLRLQEALTFKYFVLILFVITKALQWLYGCGSCMGLVAIHHSVVVEIGKSITHLILLSSQEPLGGTISLRWRIRNQLLQYLGVLSFESLLFGETIPHSKCLLRINGREVSLQLLHILVHVLDVDGLL